MTCVFQTLLCVQASSFLKPVCMCVLSHFCPVRLFVTLWTVTHQAPLSMGFSRQEYWSGCHFLLYTDVFRKTIPEAPIWSMQSPRSDEKYQYISLP